MSILEQAWNDLVSQSDIAEVSDDLTKLCRMSFYAGAASAIRAATSDDNYAIMVAEIWRAAEAK